MHVGHRTIKVALGVAISITIAQFFGLSNFALAGVVTVLSIHETKKRSLVYSGVRLCACMLGIIWAYVMLEFISYHPLVLVLLLLVHIPLLYKLNLFTGMPLSTVVILHLYTLADINAWIIADVFLLLVIGIGVALIINLYMPSSERKLKQLQQDVENNISKIFREFSAFLCEGDRSWDGKEITETVSLLNEAKSLAFRDVENHFLRLEDKYYYYFEMREKQFEVVERMMPIISSLSHTVEQGIKIADFLIELSEGVHPGNTANYYLQRLNDLRVEINDMPLPQTREKFEVRASLYQFLIEMERYLVIKSQFKTMRTND